MKQYDFDVDIDLADRDSLVSLLACIPASINKKGNLAKHNSGVYLQNIPIVPLNYFASLDYKKAKEDGWFKIDLLNNSVYKEIKDISHLEKLMNQEPIWEILEDKNIIKGLMHVNKHYDIVSKYKPKSVEQLAMVLAMIRPAKKHLLDKSWKEIEKEIWQKPKNDSYFFKKSHAIAYALVIVVQMNLLYEKAFTEIS